VAQTARILSDWLDFGDASDAGNPGVPGAPPDGSPRRLRLATPSRALTGPEKYRILDLKRRRAQIRARRVLGLVV
jgi:hypothetical protein